MTKALTRLCIYPKDVQRITGKSEKASRRLLQTIKEVLGKKEHQFITSEEFATYSGIDANIVREYLVD